MAWIVACCGAMWVNDQAVLVKLGAGVFWGALVMCTTHFGCFSAEFSDNGESSPHVNVPLEFFVELG